MIVTFLGHSRFLKSEEYERKMLELLAETVNEQSAELYLGGYGDFDKFAYECCLKFKKTHPGVSLIFISPYMTIEYQKNHLEYIKQRYDEIVYPNIEDKPLRFAISYRNKWMVERADCVICAIDHDWGGAYKTYQYAKRKKKVIFNIFAQDF